MITSSGNSGVKGRDGSKSFEENPLYHGPNSTKVGNYLNGGVMGSKTGTRGERGYDTFREKKIVEKYPME